MHSSCSMCIFCPCAAYDLGTCQSADIPVFVTFCLFCPSEVLTLGWTYDLGILACTITCFRKTSEEGEEAKEKTIVLMWSTSLEQTVSSFFIYLIFPTWFRISLFTPDMIYIIQHYHDIILIDTTKSRQRRIAVRKLNTERLWVATS